MSFCKRVCLRVLIASAAVVTVAHSAATLVAKELCPSVRATASPGEERVLAALDETAPPMEFVETPLRDVMQYIKDAKGIEIVIDESALEEKGHHGETPVSVDLKGISLRAALGLLLSNMKCDYLIRDEVLLITTADTARHESEVRLYDVSALLDEGESADGIARLLQRTFSHPPRPTMDPATASTDRMGMGMGGRRPSRAGGEMLGFGGEEGGMRRRARGGLDEEGMIPPARSVHDVPSHRQFYAYDQVILAHDTERGHRQVAQFLNALGQALGKTDATDTHGAHKEDDKKRKNSPVANPF